VDLKSRQNGIVASVALPATKQKSLRASDSCVTYSVNMHLAYVRRGTQWRSWLRHCATSQKVAGSISDSVIRIFY
jgi:hypothetical protein